METEMYYWFVCLNTGEIIFALITASLLIIGPAILIRHYYREQFRNHVRILEPEKTFSTYEREMLRHGFIFTTLWRIADIQVLAKGYGLQLDHADAIRVVSIVKRDFDPSRGLSNFTILLAIRKLARERV